MAVDIPDHLRALTGGDAAARTEAADHTNSSIVHQGTLWTTTGPVVDQVCALVRQDATGDARTLAEVLQFLYDVAEAVGLADEDLDSRADPLDGTWTPR
ncbi:hypothetical protein [Streptomyces griseorubiginosus]|uniref:hypothetical protein n=1 Tax=Streptomyces griseorubiginosus TaxID=67304 RepID=UPI0036EDB5C4